MKGTRSNGPKNSSISIKSIRPSPFGGYLWRVKEDEAVVFREIKKKPYYKWIVFANVAVGTFMATLDSSIVNVALPTVSEALGADKESLQWVVTAYLLTISSLLMAFGRLADIIGKNRVYATGFLGFVAGSLLCGLADSVEQLIAFRVVQAIGAAMIMANGMGLVTSVFPPGERGRALGTGGMIVALGSMTGPSLGGLLVSTLGWRSIFYINIPIGLLGFVAAVLILPKDTDIMRKQKFDYPGAVLFGTGITSLLLGLAEGREMGWSAPGTAVLLLISLLLMGSFMALQFKVRQPMIDMSLFSNRVFFAGNVAAFLSFTAMFFTIYLLPFYMAEVLALKPYEMGLAMTAFPLVMAMTAPVSGRLSDRVGPLYLTTGGLGIKALALFLLAFTVSVDSPLFSIAWKMGLMGFGAGLFQSPNNSSVMNTVPRSKLGVSGGVLSTVRNVGMVIGVAISVTIFEGRFAALQNSQPWQEAYVSSLSVVFIAAGLVALAGAAVCLIRGPAGEQPAVTKPSGFREN